MLRIYVKIGTKMADVKEDSNLWWIRNNTIVGIELFTIGSDIKNPLTLNDMKGKRSFLKMVSKEGDTLSIPLTRKYLDLLELTLDNKQDLVRVKA